MSLARSKGGHSTVIVPLSLSPLTLDDINFSTSPQYMLATYTNPFREHSPSKVVLA